MRKENSDVKVSDLRKGDIILYASGADLRVAKVMRDPKKSTKFPNMYSTVPIMVRGEIVNNSRYEFYTYHLDNSYDFVISRRLNSNLNVWLVKAVEDDE